MKTSIAVGGATHANIRGMVEFVQQAERLGVDYVWSAEASGCCKEVCPMARPEMGKPMEIQLACRNGHGMAGRNGRDCSSRSEHRERPACSA